MRAEDLVDFRLAEYRRALDEGFAYFYAREARLEQLLPPPLINELGRAYLLEEMRQKVVVACAGELAPDAYGVLHGLGLRDGYRNFLQPGTLQIDFYDSGYRAYDKVADDVTVALANQGELHFTKDMYRHQYRWMRNAAAQCSLTEESVEFDIDGHEPVRNPALPLWRDSHYWCERYYGGQGIVKDMIHAWSADLPIKLMAVLAPGHGP